MSKLSTLAAGAAVLALTAVAEVGLIKTANAAYPAPEHNQSWCGGKADKIAWTQISRQKSGAYWEGVIHRTHQTVICEEFLYNTARTVPLGYGVMTTHSTLNHAIQVCRKGNSLANFMSMRVNKADSHGNATATVIAYGEYSPGCYTHTITYPIRKFRMAWGISGHTSLGGNWQAPPR